ncbi:MAG TPA: undecaprenyl-phosphate glucose phosphotransferase [Vicinamibacteria bacterium]|jgi:Undecaprenyl-phosphate glucose phosphotransferase|nr:undecaprenyl-phosphate glucose phosphotransferase [Vicinamibacteria bacterium]
MVKFQTRVMVAAFVLVDVVATNLAWILAYLLRFEALGRVIPVTKGVPELSRYLLLLPLLSLLWPAVLYFHGLYQVKRGRSRIDEFFGILFSVLIASALTLGATLYVRVYYRFQPGVAPLWEYSQAVVGLFILLDVLLLNLGRHGLRRYLERLWAAGYNVRRVLVAGAGDLGAAVAETLGAHRELGYRVLGFLDDTPGHPGPAGLPVLGTLEQAAEVARETGADQIYVALPLEDHAKLVGLIKAVSNECLDIKVVPDLVQYATIKAALEDLDGIPIISLNEVPLRGWNSMVKRVMDVVIGSAGLTFLFLCFLPVIAVLIKLFGGKGPVLLRQERMTLDGRTFQIFKFRTMVDEAEKDTGPVFASSEDPRRTPIGAWLRRFNLDEFPQLINVVRGDMSLVGPRPERPPFVAQFKKQIPQYMLRHRVKSGITGWAQVNGWRGNTSIEKRIEYDLYYIENWSLLLDIKILILTLFRGFGQKHAY